MGQLQEDVKFQKRLDEIISGIQLGMRCEVIVGRDAKLDSGRFFFQIGCYRKDVVTGEMSYGKGGKAYLSPFASDSELVQTVFGLYKGYWEHEARETFEWRGRRVFGPHISTEALWDIAERTDARQHLE